MRKEKEKGDNEDSANNKIYIKKILKILVPSGGAIGIFNILNWIHEFIKPKLTVLTVCIIFVCILIVCTIILLICHEFISYKKTKIYEQEQTKRVKYYLKSKEKILIEKEKTKQAKIERNTTDQIKEIPYDCKIYEMNRIRKTKN